MWNVWDLNYPIYKLISLPVTVSWMLLEDMRLRGQNKGLQYIQIPVSTTYASFPLCPWVPKRVTQRSLDVSCLCSELVSVEEHCLGEIHLLEGSEKFLCSKGFLDANTTLRNDPGDKQSEPRILGRHRKTWRSTNKPLRSFSPNNCQTQSKMIEMNQNTPAITIIDFDQTYPFKDRISKFGSKTYAIYKKYLKRSLLFLL